MNRFEKILLTVFFVELFVGGGGRLIDFGFLSIRQVLFILLILTLIFRIIKQKAFLDKEINTFFRFNPLTIGVYGLLIWFVVSAAIGFVNGHPLSIIVMDFFRVSFFLVYFPLAYYISDQRFSKQRIITILKYSALAVAIFTIVVSLLGKTVFSANFGPFYLFMNSIMNDDLFFRPSNSVFYKSHLFVLIALIIALNEILNKKYSKLNAALIVLGTVSVLWSETRGFLIALLASLLMIIFLDAKVVTDVYRRFSEKFKVLFESRWFLKKASTLLVIMILIPFLYKYMTIERFEQEVVVEDPSIQDESDSAKETEINDTSVNSRLEFMVDSKRILMESPVHFIFGTGYGTEIADRLDGIEMSFLDILVEQGFIGLAIWLYLCLLVFYNYYKGYKKGRKPGTLEISLMAAFIGLILVTNINPFINNPIGISIFLVILIFSQNWKDTALNGELK
nr:O-antigen ligase family protein [Neobacillus sp. Marseille-Q6967]